LSPAAPVQPSHAGSAPLSPLIHLIDDDAAVRDSLALLIGTVGLRVQAWADPLAFIKGFDRHGIGAIVLDVRMPGLSGLSVLDLLLRQGADQRARLDSGQFPCGQRNAQCRFARHRFGHGVSLSSVASLAVTSPARGRLGGGGRLFVTRITFPALAGKVILVGGLAARFAGGNYFFLDQILQVLVERLHADVGAGLDR